ncbi:MAG: alpha/beta fold hydrolase [Sulfurifustaceae bacterium]
MFVWLLGVVIVVIAWRMVLLYRVSPQHHAEPFDGVVYRVGTASVVERASANPRATVICMHGFVEDVRYFTQFYAEREIQLILVVSADYHVPITNPQYRSADWIKTPLLSEGTIEYDAMVLTQALEHLPKAGSVRVHGHSRGGAVVLEAAAMRPDLFRDVEVILEAPVLPGAQPRRPMSPVMYWLFPFLVVLWRRQPISNYNRRQWGRLDNPRKRELIMGFPFNPKRVVTMIRNVKSIAAWQARKNYDLYRSVGRGTVLIGDDDQVLDPISMRASAERAAGSLRTVWLQNCSHFVLWDQPSAIPPLEMSGATRRTGARAL